MEQSWSDLGEFPPPPDLLSYAVAILLASAGGPASHRESTQLLGASNHDNTSDCKCKARLIQLFGDPVPCATCRERRREARLRERRRRFRSWHDQAAMLFRLQQHEIGQFDIAIASFRVGASWLTERPMQVALVAVVVRGSEYATARALSSRPPNRDPLLLQRRRILQQPYSTYE
jgi:hypothetical protein